MAAEKIEALELDINAKLSTENLDKLISSLQKLSKELDKINSKKASDALKDVGDSAEQASESTEKLASSVAGQAVKITALIALYRKVSGVISDSVDKSLTYNKTLNMFTVSLGEYAENATKYGNTVKDALGIDISGWQKSQGVFQTLIKGFGVGGDQAAYMSQNLTQLTYDLASYWNLTSEETANKIKSALAGRLEPIRGLGFDLSQTKLTDLAKNPANYGRQTFYINEQTGAIESNTEAVDDNTQHKIVNFNQLTQQEKVQLRYIALMTQATEVQGNYGRTLRDPANQMRVLREQTEMTSRALGNIFIPALNAVLPYLTAFSQLAEEAFNSLASLFGYEIPDLTDRIGDSSIVEPYNDIVQATGTAAKNAKKIRDYTIGIDELNVLREPTTGGGGGSAGGQQSNLNNLLTPGYDFLSKAIKSSVEKAKEDIRLLFDGFKQHPFEFPLKLMFGGFDSGAAILGENFWEAFLGMTPEELAIQAEANGRTVGEEFAIAWITAVENGCEDIIEVMFGSPEGLAQRAGAAGRTVAEQFLYEFATRMVKTKTDDIWGVPLQDRAKYMFGADFGNTSANEAYKQSKAYKDAIEAEKRMQKGMEKPAPAPNVSVAGGGSKGSGTRVGTGKITTTNANISLALPKVTLGNTAADEARKAGEKLVKAYNEGINSGKTDAYNAGLAIYNSSINGSDNNGKGGQMFNNTAANEAYKYAMGLSSAKAKSNAYISGQTLASQGVNGSKALANDSNVGFNYAGKQSGAGYVAGVNNKTNLQKAKEAGATIATNALKKLKEVLGIHSPSTEYEEAGMFSDMGYANGVEKYAYLAVNATKRMANASVKALNTTSGLTSYSGNVPITSNAGYNNGMANQSAMMNLASNIYSAIVSGMSAIESDNEGERKTVVMIDGKEVFNVVQNESRKRGVAISNGAFSTI